MVTLAAGAPAGTGPGWSAFETGTVCHVERALAVASFAGVALAAAVAEDRAANLEVALSSSRTIGTAVGVLVERHRLTEDRAFELLRLSSMHSNRKLVDVARDLVECGELAGEAAVMAQVLHTDTPRERPAWTPAGDDGGAATPRPTV